MPDDATSRRESIERMLNPRSVAVIGATTTMVYGGRFVASAKLAGDNLRVYPVNPKYEEVMGLRCYPSVRDLPEVPDVVGIVVPHHVVLDVLEECHELGVKGAIVVSAGFSERDRDDRRDLQARLGEFAETSGLRVLGPNCLGVANPTKGIWLCGGGAAPSGMVSRAGSIGVISQSGAAAFATILVRAIDLGIGMSVLISTGNEVDLDFADFARYLLTDPNTKVIAGYVEGFKDARKFVEVAELAAERGVPIVLSKTGRSTQGAVAARAHTASLTGSDAIYQGIFDQYGIIRANDYEDLLQVANLLAHTPPPRRHGVGLMSHSGGINAMTSDLLGLAGFELPPLSETTKDAIEHALHGFGWAANPTDMTGQMYSDAFGPILHLMAEEPEIGTVVIASAGNESHVEALVAEREHSETGFVYLWTGTHDRPAGLELLRSSEVPVFYTPSALASGLLQRRDYYDWRERFETHGPKACVELSAEQSATLSRLTGAERVALSASEASELLASFGVESARYELVDSAEAAVAAARRVGHPVVLKADAPDLAHKTELGVVRLHLLNDEQVSAAYEDIVATMAASAPEISLSGVLVQQQVQDAVESFIGITYDPQVGPVIAFGLGGVTVELYQDIVFRSCPLSASDARQMTTSIRAAALLRGFRGAPESDLEALVQTIVAVSNLAVALEGTISEVEINPLMVLPKGRGVLAVDALGTFRPVGTES